MVVIKLSCDIFFVKILNGILTSYAYLVLKNIVNDMKKMNTKINTAMLIPRQIDTKQPPFREYSMLLSSGECVNTKFARLLPLFLNSAGVPPYLNTIFRSASRSTEPILA